MLDDTYFYNATIKKTVAVFGSLFNNIYVGKLIGEELKNVVRVPLSYGPHQRFLSRIRKDVDNKKSDVAVKLPRMSFEITSISYDATSKLNPNNNRVFDIVGDTDSKTVVRQSTPYILGMSLSVMARDQDSALQVLEQIIPSFSPAYTLTVKNFEGPGSKTDLPIVLNGVSMQDDYEGDFEGSRRTIIYTLEFSLKIKFIGTINNTQKIIKSVTVNITAGECTDDNEQTETITVSLGDPENDTSDNFTIVTDYGF